jgi:hypothetical protein
MRAYSPPGPAAARARTCVRCQAYDHTPAEPDTTGHLPAWRPAHKPTACELLLVWRIALEPTSITHVPVAAGVACVLRTRASGQIRRPWERKNKQRELRGEIERIDPI